MMNTQTPETIQLVRINGRKAIYTVTEITADCMWLEGARGAISSIRKNGGNGKSANALVRNFGSLSNPRVEWVDSIEFV